MDVHNSQHEFNFDKTKRDHIASSVKKNLITNKVVQETKELFAYMQEHPMESSNQDYQNLTLSICALALEQEHAAHTVTSYATTYLCDLWDTKQPSLLSTPTELAKTLTQDQLHLYLQDLRGNLLEMRILATNNPNSRAYREAYAQQLQKTQNAITGLGRTECQATTSENVLLLQDLTNLIKPNSSIGQVEVMFLRVLIEGSGKITNQCKAALQAIDPATRKRMADGLAKSIVTMLPKAGMSFEPEQEANMRQMRSSLQLLIQSFPKNDIFDYIKQIDDPDKSTYDIQNNFSHAVQNHGLCSEEAEKARAQVTTCIEIATEQKKHRLTTAIDRVTLAQQIAGLKDMLTCYQHINAKALEDDISSSIIYRAVPGIRASQYRRDSHVPSLQEIKKDVQDQLYQLRILRRSGDEQKINRARHECHMLAITLRHFIRKDSASSVYNLIFDLTHV